MSQYRTGTVTVTNGSAVVAGNGTTWLTNVEVGDSFKVSGVDAVYSIGSVNSDTQITLTSVWAGSTSADQGYQIGRDVTPNNSIPEVWSGDRDWPFHLTVGLRLIDTLLAALGSVGASSGTVSDIDTGTETVDSFDDTDGAGCFWNYVVVNGANVRAGTIMTAWDETGDTVEYTETSTLDVGDTSDLTFAVDIDSDTVRLRATAGSDDWEVRYTRILM
jgi:hypothetical protein